MATATEAAYPEGNVMLDKLRARLEESREGGFTLIELLIVIVILGVLAAIVVFAVGGITDRGKSSACKQDKKTLETAIEAYYANAGAYPATLDALTANNKYLHADSTISGSTKTTSDYTLTYSAGTVTASNLSSGTTC